MIIDETFMWLYLLHKAGQACIPLGVISGAASVLLCAAGIGFSLSLESSPYDKTEREIGRKMLGCLWFSVPALFVFILVGSLSPSKDELKAYAAYRIGEKVVSSDEAQRLMNAALMYLEGKAESAKCGH